MSLLIRPNFKECNPLKDSNYESSEQTYTEDGYGGSEPKRKDPEQEFFKMSLVAYKLNNPNSTTLPNTDPAFMFRAVKKTDLAFYHWPDWIKE